MSLYRDEGIVLRTYRLGEADRIVVLLTRGRGKVRAVAKGVRKTKSKFGARLVCQEAPSGVVHQHGSFAAHRLTDERRRANMSGKSGRMKLNKFEIGERGAGARG